MTEEDEMNRLLASMVLGLALAGAAHADRVKVGLRYELPGLAQMPVPKQGQVNAQTREHLAQSVSKVMKLTDFDANRDGDSLLIQLRGDWLDDGTLAECSEILKKMAQETAASNPEAKLSIAHYRVEVEDEERDARERDAREREMKAEKEELIANRERARPQPRLDIEVKDKLIEDLTILDVPLVRVMDRLGNALPVAYVLHPEVVGRPVYIRLRGVTLEEALAAIAESARVKIEKREKYLTFVPATPER